ncbi:MAG: hypothetical protein FP816_01955 [Desulfobacteraceae bacterium]|nr:hypothetical protein [Desulfobacteraceae bacterium]
MKRFLIAVVIVAAFFLTVPAVYAGQCEDSGACTLANGECGAECNGQCLPFDEARCCLSGMCYRDGSWCGGVECDGTCMAPEEAKCCMSGCEFVNGSCKCPEQ